MDLTLSALSTISFGSLVSPFTMSKLRIGTVGPKICNSSCRSELARSGLAGSTRIFTTLPRLVPMKRTSKLTPARFLAPWCKAILVKSSLVPDLTKTGTEGLLWTGASIKQWFLMKCKLDSGRLVLWL